MFDPLLIGHQQIRKDLLGRIGTGSLRGAMLFAGPNCIGKRRVALELAKRELCLLRNACGQCPNCATFSEPMPKELPNLLRIVPEGKAGLIRIGAVRDNDLVDGGIIQWAYRASLPNYNRWIIIEDAHCLNDASANMILKILEEPPLGTYFILVTHRPEAVTSTIRSRCERINFKLLSNNETWTVAKNSGWEDSQKELWTTLASGTFSYLDFETFHRISNQIDAWIKLLSRSALAILRDSILPKKELNTSQSEQLRKSLEILLLIISDINRCRNNKTPHLKPWLAEIQRLADSTFSVEQSQLQLFESLRNIMRNPNPESILREIATSLYL
jgi:DNA polymerase-3 subunit delta'